MTVRIDYEAALIEHDDRAAFEGERGDCINLDDMKAIVGVALPDGDLLAERYPHPGDGTELSPDELSASETAWHQVLILKKQGYLVKVERGES
ncbi:hypothetical protein LCGC14_0984520 [marine sediment metagenome]|uniref:Uncharacterized protein n=1 Tax=marine sediment metagenome TaxID=412755 RepID=A0A0F9NU17_9ZZZZ